MDNISHSLVGLAFAESVYQCYEKKVHEPQPHFRNCLWGVSFLANNIPDLDYLYVLLLGGGRLEALLHHRGHTHTLLVGIPQGLVLGFFFLLLSKRLNGAWNRLQVGIFLAVSVMGSWIHVAMDSLNSYGSHPFWPFDKSWYYSDTLFIVEPLFWICFTPLLFVTAPHILLRVIFSTLFVSIIFLCWISGMVLPELSLVITLAGIFLFFFSLRVKRVRYLHAATWVFCFLFIAVFHKVSSHTKSFIERILTQQNPGTVVHDVVLTPLPVNPFCWGTVVIESLGPVTSYKVRRAIITPFPSIVDLKRCLGMELAQRYLKMGQLQSVEPRLHWFGLEEFNVLRLRQLARVHCGFSAWLRFARVPAFEEREGKLIARDMRYDVRTPNFTQVEFPLDMPGTSCGLGVNWDYPRQDLLRSD